LEKALVPELPSSGIWKVDTEKVDELSGLDLLHVAKASLAVMNRVLHPRYGQRIG
jgi:hypothetical protein